VSNFQVRYSKKGNRFCIFRLEDQSTGVKCLAWADNYSKFSEFLKDDALLIVEGRVESNEGQEITLILDDVKKLEDAVPLKARNVKITLPANNLDEIYFEKLFSILSRSKGNCEVYIDFILNESIALKMLSLPLRTQGSIKIEDDLKSHGCRVDWIL
jgi:DNA polymerase-3 subunit alpha